MIKRNMFKLTCKQVKHNCLSIIFPISDHDKAKFKTHTLFNDDMGLPPPPQLLTNCQSC